MPTLPVSQKFLFLVLWASPQSISELASGVLPHDSMDRTEGSFCHLISGVPCHFGCILCIRRPAHTRGWGTTQGPEHQEAGMAGGVPGASCPERQSFLMLKTNARESQPARQSVTDAKGRRV